MPPAEPGRVILLNGASSSGKSTVARELLPLLDGIWFLMSVDDFHAMRTRRDYEPEQLSDVLRRTRAGFHRAAAGMAVAGNNVVVDHVLSEQWRLLDCLEVFTDLEVTFVGVRCSLDELERRERARGDRPVGLGAQQAGQVHRHGLYDVECDTTVSTARECAVQIVESMSGQQTPQAFARLRQSLT